MKLYLAGERAAMATTAAIRRLGGESAAAVWTKHVKRRLFSFYYHGYSGSNYEKLPSGLSTAIADSIDFGWELFLDSGAFTAFTKQVKIDEAYLNEYAVYIKRCLPRKIFSIYSSLDAIGRGDEAALASLSFFQQLQQRKCPVFPVWHVREPERYLQRYIDDGHDYILIGGMVPETTRWLKDRLDGIWAKHLTDKDGLPIVKIHGFGLTDSRLMFRYPWYSVDSSSWLMTGIFGACMFKDVESHKLRKVVFSEDSPQARNFKGWHYANLGSVEKNIVDGWLEPYGVAAEQLGQHYSFRDVVNAAVFQSLEDFGTDRFVPEQLTIWDAVWDDEDVFEEGV